MMDNSFSALENPGQGGAAAFTEAGRDLHEEALKALMNNKDIEKLSEQTATDFVANEKVRLQYEPNPTKDVLQADDDWTFYNLHCMKPTLIDMTVANGKWRPNSDENTAFLRDVNEGIKQKGDSSIILGFVPGFEYPDPVVDDAMHGVPNSVEIQRNGQTYQWDADGGVITTRQ